MDLDMKDYLLGEHVKEESLHFLTTGAYSIRKKKSK